jgi:hypothetical protein
MNVSSPSFPYKTRNDLSPFRILKSFSIYWGDGTKIGLRSLYPNIRPSKAFVFVG